MTRKIKKHLQLSIEGCGNIIEEYSMDQIKIIEVKESIFADNDAETDADTHASSQSQDNEYNSNCCVHHIYCTPPF